MSVKKVNRVNCMVMESDQTCDGDHVVVYIDVELQCCILKTYIIKKECIPDTFK